MGQITLPISEIFYSLQGEGKLVGTPSVFVRLAGCPIRCDWCDTSYAWDTAKANRLSVNEIISCVKTVSTQIGANKCKGFSRHIVVTGGEPLIHRNLKALINELRNLNFHITVETSGIMFREFLCSLMSISPKLDNPRYELKPDVIRKLISQADDYQIKFVIDKRSEIEKVLEFIDKYRFVSRDKIMLMPKAKSHRIYDKTAPKVAKWALEFGLIFCDRLQLALDMK